MNGANPYQTSKSESGGDAVADPHRPPYVWSGVPLFIGGCFLLLLNGQVFTNTLIFLGSAAVSGMMWTSYVVRSGKTDKGRLAAYVLLAQIVVLIAFAAGLPSKYRWQQEFNRNMKDATERALQPAR